MLALALTTTLALGADRPLVGAIRWDCWYGAGGPVAQVERSLGPRKFHWRLPFFGKVVADDQVSINGDSAEVMDREIAYALQAGLDYWAFVDYGDEGDLTIGRRRYQEAKDKKGIRYCFIEEGGRFDSWGTKCFPRMVEQFKNADYLKVAGGRPLLFIFGRTTKLTKADFEELARQTQAAGLARPYIAFMGWNPEADAKVIAELGFDAWSAYAKGVGYKGTMQPFETVAREVSERYWAECRRLGLPTVTFASTGWDTRPRQEHPPTWIKGIEPIPDPTPAAQQQPQRDAVHASPEQLAAHVKAAVDWTQANPTLCPANAVILYAWNENDEGGWLIPTLGEGDARIRALAGVLRPTAGPAPGP